MAAAGKMEYEEKLVKTLPYGAFETLSKLLRHKADGKDWRSLADQVGFTLEEVRDFEEEQDPVAAIFKKWTTREVNATTAKLIDCLSNIGRKDAVEDLKPFLEKAMTPEEYKQSQAKLQETKKQENSNGPSTIDEHYDAFISYAVADRDFAKMILSRLETDYNLKVCIDFRDFLPGAHKLEQIVEVIEDRCNKVIVILSQDYMECEECDHQAKVAMSLSPGCKQRRLIPILYKACEVPKIIKGVRYLDYLDEDHREYFWDILNKVIKRR
eukprot:Seg116.2 transcript_id=Seg116.2/GoldUCD/mRNA.D3Y31 product="Myeloid differentiation primary response protein MyD88-A" protein_id=Seg116.2/GoldUCD/D3Y31